MSLIPDPYVLLAKLGGAVLGIAVIAAMSFYKGMEHTQERWDAAVAEQQMRTGDFIMRQTYNSVRSERTYQEHLRHREAENLTLSMKVRDYENGTSQKCKLSPDFESTADSLIRVRQSAADSLPAAADSASVTDGKDQPGLRDTAVLRFIETAVAKYNACTDQLNALIDWENSSRRIAMEGAGRIEREQ